jgi:hypothetical protein
MFWTKYTIKYIICIYEHSRTLVNKFTFTYNIWNFLAFDKRANLQNLLSLTSVLGLSNEYYLCHINKGKATFLLSFDNGLH